MFYVYFHRRNDTGEIFYIGKGKGRRAYWNSNRNKHWNYIVEKHGYSVEIYKYNLSEADAFSLEKEMIASFGRSNLCNYTDGGDGASGNKRSEESKQNIREKMIGRKFSEETINKMKIVAKNRSIETRMKQAMKITGRKHTDEHKAKIALAGIGRVCKEETKAKLRLVHLGKKRTPEAIEKTAQSRRKPVFCFNNNTIYISATHAGKALNIKHVSEVCTGKLKTAKGYKFKYV